MPSTLGIVASGVQGFSPLELSPVLWLDASDATTITSSGSPATVSQWNDKSGNGYNVTQATGANQPTTGTRTQNGLNAIDFDGTNDQLRSGAVVTQITTSKALTQFVVVKSDRTSAASEGIVGAQRGNFDYNTGWLQERRTTFLAFSIGKGESSDAAGQYNAARFSNSSTSTMVFTVSVSAAANTKAAYVNTTANTLTSFDNNMASSNFLAAGSANHTINIGGRGSLSGTPFDGFIAELILYDTVLSDTNRQLVWDYLNAKWAIY